MLIREPMPRNLQRLPKAHLHLHLEGSMRTTTLADLAERHGLGPPPEADGSFTTFLKQYDMACQVLRSPEDLERLVREIVEDAAADGAVWVEPAYWITSDKFERLGVQRTEEALEIALHAAERASRDNGIGVGFMMSTDRRRSPTEAVETAHIATRYADLGVVSFGLAGDETLGTPEPYAEAFAIARSAGLIPAPHAGEHGGPESIRGALDALGASRILHGVRAVEDRQLLERLATEQVCLDVCPTSNVHLGVVPTLRDHQLPALLAAGVPVSLNADDPTFFGSSLLDEYQLARDVFGLDDETLAHIASCSVRASGAPESLKTSARSAIQQWLE
jgi:adenosine deaminase